MSFSIAAAGIVGGMLACWKITQQLERKRDRIASRHSPAGEALPKPEHVPIGWLVAFCVLLMMASAVAGLFGSFGLVGHGGPLTAEGVPISERILWFALLIVPFIGAVACAYRAWILSVRPRIRK